MGGVGEVGGVGGESARGGFEVVAAALIHPIITAGPPISTL